MKPAAARTVHQVDFGNKPAPRRDSAPEGRVPRVARLLALAYLVERKIEAGEIGSYSRAARMLGMSRSRMSQVVALLDRINVSHLGYLEHPVAIVPLER